MLHFFILSHNFWIFSSVCFSFFYLFVFSLWFQFGKFLWNHTEVHWFFPCLCQEYEKPIKRINFCYCFSKFYYFLSIFFLRDSIYLLSLSIFTSILIIFPLEPLTYYSVILNFLSNIKISVIWIGSGDCFMASDWILFFGFFSPFWHVWQFYCWMVGILHWVTGTELNRPLVWGFILI